MNSTYKMFAVNEKIILYILFLIVLQFFYISQLPCMQISIDLYRHVIGGKVHISTIYPSLWWELYQLAYGRLLVCGWV